MIPSTEWCQSYDTLQAEFSQMRNQYKARYVRMYSWCDDDGTYLNNFIRAAYSAGLGVYATIWFGCVVFCFQSNFWLLTISQI